jgi:hypothetical protein
MATNLTHAVTLRNTMLDALTTALGTSPLLRLYSTAQPANPDTAVTDQVLLAELPCSSAFAPGASGGVLTASTITSDSDANADGTATWFRLCTSAGVGKLDGSVGTSGCDFNMNSNVIQIHSTVTCSSFVITGGA